MCTIAFQVRGWQVGLVTLRPKFPDFTPRELLVCLRAAILSLDLQSLLICRKNGSVIDCPMPHIVKQNDFTNRIALHQQKWLFVNDGRFFPQCNGFLVSSLREHPN